VKTAPFVTKAIPAGDTYWVAVPSKNGEVVELCLDIGGGEGPLIATAEWISSAGMREGGFLCWVLGGDILTDAPNWMPASVIRAVQEVAQMMLVAQHRERQA
jgi:hypothetical protein